MPHEPFYTTKPAGTGLGLAICAGIVRRLARELTAFNAPAGGAVLRLSLPAISRSALPGSSRSAVPEKSGAAVRGLVDTPNLT